MRRVQGGCHIRDIARRVQRFDEAVKRHVWQPRSSHLRVRLRVTEGALLTSEELPGDSFYEVDTGKPVKVNAVFQVWRAGGSPPPDDWDVFGWADIFTVCSHPTEPAG